MTKRINIALLLCSIMLVPESNTMEKLNSINENLSNQNNNITINIDTNQHDNNVNLINNEINTNNNQHNNDYVFLVNIDNLQDSLWNNRLPFKEIHSQFIILDEFANVLSNTLSQSQQLAKKLNSLLQCIKENTEYINQNSQYDNKDAHCDNDAYVNKDSYVKCTAIVLYKTIDEMLKLKCNNTNDVNYISDKKYKKLKEEINENFKIYLNSANNVINNYSNYNINDNYVLDTIYTYIVNKINNPSNIIKLKINQLQYFYFLSVIALTSFFEKTLLKFGGCKQNNIYQYYNNWFVQQISNDNLKILEYEQTKKQNNNELSTISSKITKKCQILKNSYNELTKINNGKTEINNVMIDYISDEEYEGINNKAKEIYYISKLLNDTVNSLNNKYYNFTNPQETILNTNNNLVNKLNSNQQYFLDFVNHLQQGIEPIIQNLHLFLQTLKSKCEKISNIKNLRNEIMDKGKQVKQLKQKLDKQVEELSLQLNNKDKSNNNDKSLPKQIIVKVKQQIKMCKDVIKKCDELTSIKLNDNELSLLHDETFPNQFDDLKNNCKQIKESYTNHIQSCLEPTLEFAQFVLNEKNNCNK